MAIAILHGLVDDRFMQNDQRVPGLSRIPFLGALFRNRSKDKQKTSLMVFLRPKVVRMAKDTHKFTADRYDYILGQKRALDPTPSDTLDRFTPGALVLDPAAESDYEEEPADALEGDRLLGPPDPGVDDYTS